ncbi:MAG: leucine-rich repeat domain-containing protein [Promethearchaeota archaeon]
MTKTIPLSRMIVQNEFEVNDEITLKLENGRTILYVDGKEFLQCKHLVIKGSLNELSKVEVNSIDDIENLDLEYSTEVDITAAEEFWGHCSNLQAWAEHGFDSRLLHSNMSFPLLKELADVNPSKYETFFKEEICRRMIEGNPSTVYFLYEEGYIDRLTRDEFWSAFDFEVQPLIEIERRINEISSEPIYFKHTTRTEDVAPITREKNDTYFQLDGKTITALSLNELETLDDSLLVFILERLKKYLKIRALNIYGCEKIESLPKEIGGLKNLKWLYLENNCITSLPDTIGKLKQLEELYLANNKLSSLPEGFSALYSLEFLDLSLRTLENEGAILEI